MTFGPRIEKIEPQFAAGNGYVHIFTAGVVIEPRHLRVTIGGQEGVIKAAGPRRIVVQLPEAFAGEPECIVESGADITPPFRHGFANARAEGLHNVGNPAVDPATWSMLPTDMASSPVASGLTMVPSGLAALWYPCRAVRPNARSGCCSISGLMW